jgi:hypothetical protein
MAVIAPDHTVDINASEIRRDLRSASAKPIGGARRGAARRA